MRPDPNPRVTEREVYTNCTVEVLTCPESGRVSVGWYPNDQPPMKVLNPEKHDKEKE